MSKTISQFRFKKFSVSHHRSSMKVGVDGVLIGCWAGIMSAKRILDVGTGCGLIALIVAQRAKEASIDAIDIDVPSIEEARENISYSPWSESINVFKCAYSDLVGMLKDDTERYDLIISNPPYFDSGVTETVTAREKARHQGELSPESILKGGVKLLNEGGRVAMIVPTELAIPIEEAAERLDYSIERKCLVRGHFNAPYKRSLLQWKLLKDGKDKIDANEEYLTLELAPGVPTDEYRDLCRDFYLRF